jgi:hypothetical protein
MFKSSSNPPGGAYDALATVTLTAATATITFAGIPTGYKHLQLRVTGRDGRAVASNLTLIKFNGDATAGNYKSHALYGDGSSAAAYVDSPAGADMGYLPGSSAGANVFGTIVTDILDYASTTKNKTVRSLSGVDNNGSGIIALISAGWFSTAAITQIDLTAVAGTSFQQYSSFALYGVR